MGTAVRTEVRLEIYDLLGRRIKTLVDDTKDPGVYHTFWNADRVSSGVYFYRLTAGGVTRARAMTLMK